MSDYEEDYEDDFEDELSASERTPSTAAAAPRSYPTEARAPPPQQQQQQQQYRPSLETSFESYESSEGAPALGMAQRELSTPSSEASSRHSDPMYPTEGAASNSQQPPALSSRYSSSAASPDTTPPRQYPSSGQPNAYPAQAAPPPAFESYETTPSRGHGRSDSTYSSNHRYEATPSLDTSRETHSLRGGAAAGGNTNTASGVTPTTTSAHARPPSATSSSSGTRTDDDSGDYPTEGAAHPVPAQRHPPTSSSTHSSVPRTSNSIGALGKQSGSDTTASIHATAGAAMVATPNTRDVSGQRNSSLDDGAAGANKKKAIYQSNYTTVEELDDAPLPQHHRHSPTIDDAELSEDEDDEHDAYAELDEPRGAGHAAPAPAPAPPPQPTARPASSSSSSSSSSSTESETYSNKFTAASTRESTRLATPTPSPSAAPSSKLSSPSRQQQQQSQPASSQTSSAERRPVAPPSTRIPAKKKSTPAVSEASSGTPLPVPQRRQSTPQTESSLTSDSKNLTAPYSGMRPQQVLHPAASTNTNAVPLSPQSFTTDSTDSERGAGGERAKLLLRITDLQSEIATWDSRIERKRALIAATPAAAAGRANSNSNRAPTSAQSPSSRSPTKQQQQQQQRRGRSVSNGPRRSHQRANSKAPPGAVAARRKVSVGRGGGGGGGAVGGAKGQPMTKARLAALREKNEKLEADYARLGGGVTGSAALDVPALVARADVQLQKARERLKEVTAARRALENRDKRAAHTIEEVHRRMPTNAELQERQLNEGMYSRTALQQTLRELRENIDRTRAGSQLMETKCEELSAQVQERHLSSITPKEYEALCATRDAKRKVVERHRAAIAVYSAAVAQDVRGGGATTATPLAGGRPSQPSSRATSPRKSSLVPGQSGASTNLTPAERQAMDDEAKKAALLLDQQQALQSRKQELQSNIDDLWRRIQQRGDQIKANHTGVPIERSPSREMESPAAAVGSGAAAARSNSLRHVLQTPAGNRGKPHQPSAAAAVQKESPDAAPRRNSAAAERLRGAVAAARQSRQSRQKDTDEPAPPLDALRTPSEPAATRPSKPLPTSTGTGQRTVRGAPQPLSSSFTPLPDSPIRGSGNPWDTHEGAERGETGVTAYKKDVGGRPDAHHSTGEDLVEEDEGGPSLHRAGDRGSPAGHNAIAAEDLYLEDDGGIEAMLRKIDEDNKRIGEEVFGGAAAAPPGASAHDHGGEERGQDDEAEEGVLDEGDDDVEDVVDEVDDANAGGGGGSGRSTPDWLREI